MFVQSKWVSRTLWVLMFSLDSSTLGVTLNQPPVNGIAFCRLKICSNGYRQKTVNELLWHATQPNKSSVHLHSAPRERTSGCIWILERPPANMTQGSAESMWAPAWPVCDSSYYLGHPSQEFRQARAVCLNSHFITLNQILALRHNEFFYERLCAVV